jgi:hypothetical protein
VRDRLQQWRFWLATRSEISGLLILFLVVGAVLTLALWLLVSTHLPVGPATTVEGRIVGIGYRESERGSVRTASIELEDGVVRTAIPERFGCRVGDRVRLQRRPLRFGYSYGIGANPRPCSTD